MRGPTAGGMPAFSFVVADLARHGPQLLARHVGVSERTWRAYVAAGSAPRAVQLALYWETCWGMSDESTTAHNGQMYALRLAQSLERQKAALLARIGQLERLLEDAAGVAPNAPYFDVLRA